MKNKKLIAILAACVLGFCVIQISYDCGHYAGIDVGVEGTLDTVNKIIIRQIDSDTSITKLILVNPDTNVYFLSRRTVLIKDQ